MTILGQPLPHDSAREHVTGAALYLDDLPPIQGELLVGFVGSPVAHGRIRSLDVAAAAKVPGVSAVLTARDVPGHNTFGPVFHDEELLVEAECQYLGQPVVLIAAEDRHALDAARKATLLEMGPLPAVFSIEDAIARQNFIGKPRRLHRGDAAAALAAAEHTLEGEFHIGGQEHFYLESQAALAVPGEGGQLTVYSSTQNPTETQAVVARCLGLKMNQIVSICKRMGGGFGGKETQGAQPAIFAALVAAKTGRPARIVLTNDLDMAVTGKRHPYLVRYRVAFTAAGEITGLQIDYFSNGGFSADLSFAVLERTMLHTDNAYYLPNLAITGTVCRTNLPSNTAFRGFGGPQGVAAIENIVEEIAGRLGLDALDVRQRNCYGVGERNQTPYGQVVTHNPLPRMFEQLAASSHYRQRRAEIDAWNARSREQIRGLSLTAVKFGISFTRRTLNQGNALVNIYTDGSIQVSTGGTEMGQGLNTKIRQLVAGEFDLPAEAVLVMPTSTEKNPNTSPTAASAGTDLNGTAAVRACATLRERLAGVAASHFANAREGIEASPSHICFERGKVFDARTPHTRLTFAELVALAYELRIDLGARGYYATPGVDFNRDTGRGNPFLYYTNGVAAAEVHIDRFTGDVKVARVDVLMDIGKSINPGIDRGQVIGGFVQGMGWVTTEELRYGDNGELWTHSPTTYKIPNVSDVPAEFHLAFLDPAENIRNVYSSKAVGEPPLLLGFSVWAAVKQALLSAAGGQPVNLRLPATNEEVLRCLTELRRVSAFREQVAPG